MLPPLSFAAAFQATPAALLVLRALPTFEIAAVSDAYLDATMTRRDEIVGRPLFDVFPDNPADPAGSGASHLRASFARVLATRATERMGVQRHDIPRRRSVVTEFEERHWGAQNSPVLEGSAPIAFLVHRTEDVTAMVKGRREGPPDSLMAARTRMRIESSRDWSALQSAIHDACDRCCLDPTSRTELLSVASTIAIRMIGHAGGVAEIEAIGVDLPRGVRLRFNETERDGAPVTLTKWQHHPPSPLRAM